MDFRNLNEQTKENIKAYSISGMLIVLFYIVVTHLGWILSVLGKAIALLAPFLIGILFTFFLVPVRRRIETAFEKTKLQARTKRTIAVVLCVILLVVSIVGLFLIIIPQIVESLSIFIDSFDSYVAKLREIIMKYNTNTEVSQMLNSTLTMLGSKLTEWLTGAQGGLVTILGYSISFAKGIMNFFIGMIICVYILLDEEKFKLQFKALLYAAVPSDKAKAVVRIVRLTGKTFNSFLIGKFFDSLLIGVITYIFAVLMRMPYAPLLGFVIGLTNMIPVFGPFIGAVPSILILLLINPIQALEFLIFIVILQQIDGNIIGPRILGEAVGLPTLWVMFAILVGGALFGILGMFIGVPVFSVIYVTIKQIVKEHLQQENINIENTQEISQFNEETQG